MIAEIENIYTRLIPDTPKDSHALVELQKVLRTDAPGAKYMWSYKHGQWDGKVSLLKEDSGVVLCPTGFLPTTLKLLSANAINVRLSDLRSQIRGSLTTSILQKTTVPLRDYQWSAAKQILQNSEFGMWWPRGVLRIATGGGKTEIAASLVQMIGRNTLFIVHRKDLLHQAYHRFKKYNIPASMAGDGNFDLSSQTIVGTVQTLSKKIKERDQETLDMLNDREVVIVDEAHGIAASVDKGNQFNTLLSLCPNAFIRIGLTATPFLRDKYSNQLLEGATGGVVIDIPSRYLIEKGWLSDAEIKMIQIPPLPNCMFVSENRKKTRYQMAYTSAIELLDTRNERILDELEKLPGPNLVLVKTIAHGEILADRAKKRGIYLPFINGQNSRSERKAAVEELVRVRGNLMTTGIFDEGIDIPSLEGLILAAGGKSQGRSLQRLGRGLRKWAGKSGLKVIDFYDMSQPLKSHSEGRKRLWTSEGYKLEVVK